MADTGAQVDELTSERILEETEYKLEIALNCPHCRKLISSVYVVRLLRIKVSFISTLPRRGHVIICPDCRGIISADLGGMA